MEKTYYYVKKGEFSGEIGEFVSEDEDTVLLSIDKQTVKLPHHYLHLVPELGDTVSIESPLAFTVIERMKAGQPFVKVEAWIRVDDVTII